MKKPIIGISVDAATDNSEYSYSPKPWYALRRCYTNIISHLNAVPILIPFVDDLEPIINIIDGLIIPGALEDINPRFYGQEIKSKYNTTNQ